MDTGKPLARAHKPHVATTNPLPSNTYSTDILTQRGSQKYTMSSDNNEIKVLKKITETIFGSTEYLYSTNPQTIRNVLTGEGKVVELKIA